MLRQDQVARLLDGLRDMMRQAESAQSVDEVRESIALHPILSYMQGFIPKDLKDIAVLLGIIYGIIAFCSEQKNPQEVHANKDVCRVLEALVDGLRDSQTGTRKEEKGTRHTEEE